MNKNDRAKLRKLMKAMKEEEEKRYAELFDSIEEITNRDKNKEENKDDKD